MKLRYIVIPGAAITALLWLSTTPAFRHDTPDKKYAAEVVTAVIVIVVLSLPLVLLKRPKPKGQENAGFSWTTPTAASRRR